MENKKATILWGSPVITDRHVPCNKPDIAIQKKSDSCQIIDVAIQSYYNILKATEKMSKYVDLQIECQRLWNKKVEVIPVIIGATGIVDKNMKKYLSAINLFLLFMFASRENIYLFMKKYVGRIPAAITSTACRDQQF